MACPFETFVKGADLIMAQLELEIENEFNALHVYRDELLLKFKNEKENYCKTKMKPKKRKLDGINEEVDEDGTKKKPRPSEEGILKLELVVDNTFALENHQHSTPNKETDTVPSAVSNQSISEDKSTTVDKPRTKRNASVLASVMNNKLLNEKLNHKVRRPGSREMTHQDLLLDKLPYVVLSNSLKNASQQQKLSFPKSKGGSAMQVESSNEDVTINVSGQKKVSQCTFISEEVPDSADITLDKVNKKNNISNATTHQSPGPVRNTCRTRSTVTNNSINISKNNEIELGDATIMPPPMLPIKKGKKSPKTRGARSRKTNRNTVVDSESDCHNDTKNISTKSTRRKINDTMNDADTSKVGDESMGHCTRSTRSRARNNTSTEPPPPPPPVEKPKRTRTKRGKAAAANNQSEVDRETTEIVVQAPTLEEVSRADYTSSDEDFEKKKVKQRPKRTRKGKQPPPPPLPTSPPPTVDIPIKIEEDNAEKRLSNDSGVSSSGRPEIIQNEKKDETETREKIDTPLNVGSANKMDGQQSETYNEKEISKMVISSLHMSEHREMNVSYVLPDKEVQSTKLVLNETIVLDKGKGVGRQTTVISSVNIHEEVEKGVPPQRVLNETITLPAKDPPGQQPLDQTVTIVKGEVIQCDPNESLLTDDLSEVEDTPPRTYVSKIITNGFKKLKDAFATGSPVKTRVQHFERLAEAAAGIPSSSEDHVDGPTRVTRTKTRAMAAKETEQEDKQEEMKPKPAAPTRKVSRSKLATPISARTIAQLKLPLPVPSSKQISVKLGSVQPPPSDSFMSPRSNAAQFLVREEDAIRKREAILHARSEKQRIKREEKSRAAAQAREQQNKLKQAQMEKNEKEKEEKMRNLQLEREEKMKMEAEKKRILLERRNQELEERRRLDEATRQARLAEQEEEARRQAAAKQKQAEENEKLRKKMMAEEQDLAAARKLQEMKSQAAASKLLGSKKTASSRPVTLKTFEDLRTDDESEDEKHITRHLPAWTKHEHRRKPVKIQSFVKDTVIDTFYSTTKFTPNLAEIFPQIDKRKLVRSSSAHWRTPPRYSMMPTEG